MGSDVTGIATLHTVSWTRPSPGMIFVTSTVREAAAGSGLRFNDRGRRPLKGSEGDWQLYAVEE